MERISSVATVTTSNTLRDFVNQSLRRYDDANEDTTLLLDDRVEISELAGLLSRLADLPEDRARKIIFLRNQIAQGTYETQEKLDVATTRLLTRL